MASFDSTARQRECSETPQYITVDAMYNVPENAPSWRDGGRCGLFTNPQGAGVRQGAPGDVDTELSHGVVERGSKGVLEYGS